MGKRGGRGRSRGFGTVGGAKGRPSLKRKVDGKEEIMKLEEEPDIGAVGGSGRMLRSGVRRDLEKKEKESAKAKEKQPDVKKKEDSEGPRPLRCPRCIRVFTSARNLDIHQRSHRGDPKYICLICDLFDKKKDKLVDHITEEHKLPPDAEENLQCPFCGVKWPKEEMNELKSHIASEHEVLLLFQPLTYPAEDGDGDESDDS